MACCLRRPRQMLSERLAIDVSHLHANSGVVDEDPVPALEVRAVRRLKRGPQATLDDIAVDWTIEVEPTPHRPCRGEQRLPREVGNHHPRIVSSCNSVNQHVFVSMTHMSAERARAIAEIDASLTAIGKLARSHRTITLRQRASGVDLPETTVAALAIIHRHGPMRIGEVGTIMELDASRASKEVRRLVEAGLVTQKVDPTERRASILTPTAKGKRVFERYRKAADELITDAFNDWSTTDVVDAAAAIRRVSDTFTSFGVARAQESDDILEND